MMQPARGRSQAVRQRSVLRSIVWHGLMLVWLAFLVRGLWWIWPNIERMDFTQDLLAGVLWLAMGTLAWILAFNYGRQRYWR
jgi:hypothetical protein